jgi:predicted GNAT family N-acyltransferase
MNVSGNIELKEISAKETYMLRQRVLRPHHGIDSCVWPGDEEKETFHLGAYLDEKLIGVASFYKESSPEIQKNHQFRLRGMAVHEDYRGTGLGKNLLQHAEQILRTNCAEAILWFNARTLAKGFYSKMNYEQIGDNFIINGVGPHVVMFKILKNE